MRRIDKPSFFFAGPPTPAPSTGRPARPVRRPPRAASGRLPATHGGRKNSYQTRIGGLNFLWSCTTSAAVMPKKLYPPVVPSHHKPEKLQVAGQHTLDRPLVGPQLLGLRQCTSRAREGSRASRNDPRHSFRHNSYL